MNCKDAVERLVESSSRFRVQGSRSELRNEDPALAAHIEACPACAKEAEDLARLFAILQEAEEPSDAEAAVLARRIAARLGDKDEQTSRWTLRPAWGIAAAAAAAVVLIIWTTVPGGKSGPESQIAFQPAAPDQPQVHPADRPVTNKNGQENGMFLAFVEEPDSNEMSAEEIREARITLAAADADLLARDMVDPSDVYRVFALLSEEDRVGLLSALSERRSSLGNPDRALMAS